MCLYNHHKPYAMALFAVKLSALLFKQLWQSCIIVNDDTVILKDKVANFERKDNVDIFGFIINNKLIYRIRHLHVNTLFSLRTE